MAILYGKQRQPCDVDSPAVKAEFPIAGKTLKIQLVDCDETYVKETRGFHIVETWRLAIGNMVRDFPFTLSLNDTLNGVTTVTWPIVLAHYVEDARVGEGKIEDICEDFGCNGAWEIFVGCRKARKALEQVWPEISEMFPSVDEIDAKYASAILDILAPAVEQRTLDEIQEELSRWSE